MENEQQLKNNYHYIIYHLEAMNYAKTKFEKEMSKLPSGHKLTELKKEELRKLISHIKDLVRWYKSQIEYHQQKAMSHIPKTENVKKKQKARRLENKSLENLFVNKSSNKAINTKDISFVKGNELMK